MSKAAAESENQLSLFGDDEGNTEINISQSQRLKSDGQLKCYQSQLLAVRSMSWQELFAGYDTIHMIVFSYELKFLNELLKDYKYGKVLLGGRFITEKDKKIHEEILGAALGVARQSMTDTQDELKHKTHIGELFRSGALDIHTANFFMTDHRKVYILENSETHATRVIHTSANVSKRAFTNQQAEVFSYYDDEFSYEQFKNDFDEAWERSISLPPKFIESKDIINDNPLISNMKEVDKVVIVQPAEEEDIEFKKYVLATEEKIEEYKELLKGAPVQNKNGLTLLLPKTIERMKFNRQKIRKKNIKTITENYPTITFDYDRREMMYNSESVNIAPSAEELTCAVNDFLKMFATYQSFINKKDLELTHFKLINLMFASPFFSELHFNAAVKGDEICTELPLYVMASGDSNSGKTFIIKATLKMMTGKKLSAQPNNSVDEIRKAQLGAKGTPVFFDEFGAKISNIKSHLKSKPYCEIDGAINQPLIVLASNEAQLPKTDVRKRMVFLEYSGTFSSNMSQSDMDAKGGAILKNINTVLYREYVRRMLPIVSEEIEEIALNDTPKPIKLIEKSASVLYSIIKEYADNVPEYIRPLSWEQDYSGNAIVFGKAIEEVKAEYERNPKAFIIKKEYITITGYDKTTFKSWAAGLPAEINPSIGYNREDGDFIQLKRKELEQFTGINFKKGFSLFNR